MLQNLDLVLVAMHLLLKSDALTLVTQLQELNVLEQCQVVLLVQQRQQ